MGHEVYQQNSIYWMPKLRLKINMVYQKINTQLT